MQNSLLNIFCHRSELLFNGKRPEKVERAVVADIGNEEEVKGREKGEGKMELG